MAILVIMFSLPSNFCKADKLKEIVGVIFAPAILPDFQTSFTSNSFFSKLI